MTILRGRNVVLPDGVREVDIEIRDGRITAITDSAHAPHVISGVIDAAAACGRTSVIQMKVLLVLPAFES